MGIQYKATFNRDGSYYPLTLKELFKWARDMSFQKKDVFGFISEREDDGTLGTVWSPSHIDFKLAVNNGHVSDAPDYVYCIDGKLIAGYAAAIKYVVGQGYSKAEAIELLLNI